MKQKTEVDWFSKDVGFAKTGFVVEYWIRSGEVQFLYQEGEMYESMGEMLEGARESVVAARKQGVEVLDQVLVVPLILEKTYKNRKIFWQIIETSKSHLITHLEQFLLVSKDPESARAVVVCNWAKDEKPQFKIAGYFVPNKGNVNLVKAIRQSRTPADQSVKNCGIYYTIKPFGMDLISGEVISEEVKMRGLSEVRGN